MIDRELRLLTTWAEYVAYHRMVTAGNRPRALTATMQDIPRNVSAFEPYPEPRRRERL